MGPFISNRAGSTRNNLSGELAFQSFIPADLQHVDIEYNRAIATELGNAMFELGRLRTAFESLNEEERRSFTDEMLAREARSSWLLSAGKDLSASTYSATGRPEPYQLDAMDDIDVDNLHEAIRYLLEPFDDLPVSRRLLSNAHDLLARGPRYEKKYPGQFRTSPV